MLRFKTITKKYIVLEVVGNVAIRIPRTPEFVKERNGQIVAVKSPITGSWIPASLLQR